MDELYKLIDRFQSLKNKTGTHKTSSYELNFHFSPWDESVTLNWGCYDVADYPRHYTTTTTRGNLLSHMASEIDKMENAVQEHEAQGGDH